MEATRSSTSSGLVSVVHQLRTVCSEFETEKNQATAGAITCLNDLAEAYAAMGKNARKKFKGEVTVDLIATVEKIKLHSPGYTPPTSLSALLPLELTCLPAPTQLVVCQNEPIKWIDLHSNSSVRTRSIEATVNLSMSAMLTTKATGFLRYAQIYGDLLKRGYPNQEVKDIFLVGVGEEDNPYLTKANYPQLIELMRFFPKSHFVLIDNDRGVLERASQSELTDDSFSNYITAAFEEPRNKKLIRGFPYDEIQEVLIKKVIPKITLDLCHFDLGDKLDSDKVGTADVIVATNSITYPVLENKKNSESIKQDFETLSKEEKRTNRRLYKDAESYFRYVNAELVCNFLRKLKDDGVMYIDFRLLVELGENAEKVAALLSKIMDKEVLLTPLEPPLGHKDGHNLYVYCPHETISVPTSTSAIIAVEFRNSVSTSTYQAYSQKAKVRRKFTRR